MKFIFTVRAEVSPVSPRSALGDTRLCRLGLNCISSPLVPHDPPRKTNKNRSSSFAGRSASGRVSPTALTPCTARPAHAGGPCKAPFARRQEAVVACSMRGQFVGYRNRVTVTCPHARRRAHAPSCHSDVPAGPPTPGHDPSRRSVPGGTSPPRHRPLARLLSCTAAWTLRTSSLKSSFLNTSSVATVESPRENAQSTAVCG